MTTQAQTDNLADHRRYHGIRVLLHHVLDGPPSDRGMMAAAVLGSATLVLGSATLLAVVATIRLVAP
jgi:hypothetical protein